MEFDDILQEIIDRGADKTASRWLREIEDEFGAVPLIFQRMAQRPEVLVSHLLYKDSVTHTSTIDPKYVELISLAVGAALGCTHCVEYHMTSAMSKGATRDEILEVVLIAGLLANSSVLANAYRVVDKNSSECGPSCEINGFSRKKPQE
ncbi:MAG: alkylhydroperoxidase [Methanoculleus sp. SDB]|nr:MAG: alkylhydroperoxidase [Methanoculleus sp. SDB]